MNQPQPRDNVSPFNPNTSHSAWYIRSMERLVETVQELSHARDLETITAIVKDAARSLTGADGATFVLRDGDQCYYVEENAIAPLWKGHRFPMSRCISGWVMLNALPAVIEDIYADPRIPVDAYRPTFVKSLAMIPIRRSAPIGAIGNYWANGHKATDEEVMLLQALADTTSVALENVELYRQLERKIGELEKSNDDLNSFAWAASHDLQEPLRTIATQMQLLDRELKGGINAQSQEHIDFAINSAGRLHHLVQNLLTHARAGEPESFADIELATIIENIQSDLQVLITETGTKIHVGVMPMVHGDPHLLECVFQNLLSNAIKFRKSGVHPDITLEAHSADDEWIFSVSDNGLGIDPQYQEKIFGLFQRLHSQDHYQGSGIGLATCRKIMDIHGGRIWAESAPGKGSCFWLALPKKKA